MTTQELLDENKVQELAASMDYELVPDPRNRDGHYYFGLRHQADGRWIDFAEGYKAFGEKTGQPAYGTLQQAYKWLDEEELMRATVYVLTHDDDVDDPEDSDEG